METKLSDKLIQKVKKTIDTSEEKFRETIDRWSMSHFRDGRDTNMYRFELLQSIEDHYGLLGQSDVGKEKREKLIRWGIEQLDERMDRALNFRGSVFSNGTSKMEYIARLEHVQNGLEEMSAGEFEYIPQERKSRKNEKKLSGAQVAEQRKLLEEELTKKEG